jgi:hypothetical protein
VTEYTENLDAEFIEAPEAGPEIPDHYDEPDATFVKDQYRSPVAKKYEKTVKNSINTLIRFTTQQESTIADAAALIMYGPNFAEKAGDFAAVNKTVRKSIDLITGGTENPGLAFGLVAGTLLLQLYRNHEDALRPTAAIASIKESRKAWKQRPAKRVKIPFTNRYFEIRFQWKLFKLEAVTNEPADLTAHVFTNPEILASLEKAGITLPFVVQSANGSSQSPR